VLNIRENLRQYLVLIDSLRYTKSGFTKENSMADNSYPLYQEQIIRRICRRTAMPRHTNAPKRSLHRGAQA
jgi:hypothetical protein